MPAPRSPVVARRRASVAGFTTAINAGRRRADDAAYLDAKRELRIAVLEDAIAKCIDGWPPLTDAQVARIGTLLRCTGGAA
jgi:hypothetical protein